MFLRLLPSVSLQHLSVLPSVHSVLLSVFYSSPQRLDVYVDNKLVPPTNAKWNSENTDYTLMKPISAGTSCSHTDNGTESSRNCHFIVFLFV